MNKELNELKQERTNKEKIKNLQEALRLIEELKKLTDEAFERKQDENR
jgi:hypothetical protein